MSAQFPATFDFSSACSRAPRALPRLAEVFADVSGEEYIARLEEHLRTLESRSAPLRLGDELSVGREFVLEDAGEPLLGGARRWAEDERAAAAGEGRGDAEEQVECGLSEHLRMQVSCLAGCSVVLQGVRTVEEAQAAEEWGAAALELRWPFEGSLDALVRRVSLHLLVRHEDAFFELALAYARARVAENHFEVCVGAHAGHDRVFHEVPGDAPMPPSALLCLCDAEESRAPPPGALLFKRCSGVQQALECISSCDGVVIPRLDASVPISAFIDAVCRPGGAHGGHIGVLSIQGDYSFHLNRLTERNPGKRVVPVRCAADLEGIEVLLIPGGWSNLVGQALERHLPTGLPGLRLIGTCCGLLLLASRGGLQMQGRKQVGLLDATADNNVLNGMHTVTFFDGRTEDCLFSNGPVLRELGPEVRVLATVEGGRVVAAQQGRVSVYSFHCSEVLDFHQILDQEEEK